MIENLPAYIPFIFVLTTIVTLSLFYYATRKSTAASKKSNTIFLVLIIWLTIQAALTLKGAYNANTNLFPPRILVLGVLPAIVTIVLMFTTKKGRQFIDSLPLINLTYLHVIRIPVEFTLLWLFMNKAIPQLMTFEGRNFDIISGITAPFIAYFGSTKKKLSRPIILVWNFICLGLLLNIVINALLSAPFPFQKFAFDQPNIAILYFPFSWLPTFIVPVVLLAQLTSIRQLIKKSSG